MRITGGADISAAMTKQAMSTQPIEKVALQGSNAGMGTPILEQVSPMPVTEDETKAKVQEAVEKMNQMLDVNHNASRFKYHEGLDRYYVTVVDRETDEVVKEIPPKQLLDAFYEMQKLFGMIVDEKI